MRSRHTQTAYQLALLRFCPRRFLLQHALRPEGPKRLRVYVYLRGLARANTEMATSSGACALAELDLSLHRRNAAAVKGVSRCMIPAHGDSAFGLGRSPCILRKAPAKRCARKITCLAQHINIEDNAKNPWSSPGWRGAYVSSQPEATQTALVAGVTLLGALLTYFTYTTAGPWVCNNLPLMDSYMQTSPYVLGPLFAAAGVSHYPFHEGFCTVYPHQGAWGLWYVPGRTQPVCIISLSAD